MNFEGTNSVNTVTKDASSRDKSDFQGIPLKSKEFLSQGSIRDSHPGLDSVQTDGNCALAVQTGLY